MANPLTPHFVLVQEDTNLPGPVNMVYRCQSANFNYVFNQGLMLKRRRPELQVGIVAVPHETVPFTCDLTECHMAFLSFEEYLDPKDYLVVPVTFEEEPIEYPF